MELSTCLPPALFLDPVLAMVWLRVHVLLMYTGGFRYIEVQVHAERTRFWSRLDSVVKFKVLSFWTYSMPPTFHNQIQKWKHFQFGSCVVTSVPCMSSRSASQPSTYLSWQPLSVNWLVITPERMSKRVWGCKSKSWEEKYCIWSVRCSHTVVVL